MRFAVLTAVVLTAFTAAAALLGAGSAGAVVPIGQPDRVGMHLNHEETMAIADGPLPALVSMVVPLNRIGAGLKADTEIYRDDNGGVHASLRQIMVEAADHPDGTVILYVNAPGTRDGRVLDIYQQWN
ncbi:hypothetical protein ACFQZZ_27090 [Nocardia sp. GCM10030253]|uniref:hypothetical protein n=1 Tax=Nocardia sp. GCM10030253 TaxID=3273404 RepID=UPI0036389A60